MKIFIAGDIHGRLDCIQLIEDLCEKEGIKTVIQVGDLGIHWPLAPYYWEEDDISLLETDVAEHFNKPGITWYTCGGNHDNWTYLDNRPKLAERCLYISRGKVLTLDNKKFIFFGGAESVDRGRRMEDLSWWRREIPSKTEFELFAYNLDKEKPDYVITHDCPEEISISSHHRELGIRRNLSQVISYADHRPKRWFFGHHHVLASDTFLGIDFHCCGFHGRGFILNTENNSVQIFDGHNIQG